MTRRAFCADPRKYFALALASMFFMRPRSRSGYCPLSCRRCRSAARGRRYLRRLLCLLSFRARMPLECSRGRKLAELVSDHVFRDIDRNVAFAVVHAECQANHIRRDSRTARPRLDDLRPLTTRANPLDHLTNALVNPGTFFN